MTLAEEIKGLGQTVLVLQGGGALGAYQVGVYQALHEAQIDPDWVIGTSIGAINAALIAGSPPSDRFERLREFWRRLETGSAGANPLQQWARNMLVFTGGVKHFFRPRPQALINPLLPMDPEAAGYYSVEPLRQTLSELVDLDLLNAGSPRVTVGASMVRSSQMRYFDSREERLGVEHVLASGALPPAFPAVRIDGELYWDGGILSNTPTEVVFSERPRANKLVFAVHMWNPDGPEPRSIRDVMHRQKDIQFSSRAIHQVEREQQIHRLRHIIAELSKSLPEEKRADHLIADYLSYGCLTRMHVIRLLAPTLPQEDVFKDIDFSREGIEARWEAGYRHTIKTLEQAPWRRPYDETEGVILHDACAGELVELEPFVTGAAGVELKS